MSFDIFGEQLSSNGLDCTVLQDINKEIPDDLLGIEWQFESNNTELELDNVSFTIVRNADGSYSVSGCSGINRYFFTVTETESGAVEMNNIAGTLMGGSEEDMAKESAFLSYMNEHFCGNGEQSTLEARDGNLVIHGADGFEIVFSKKS